MFLGVAWTLELALPRSSSLVVAGPGVILKIPPLTYLGSDSGQLLRPEWDCGLYYLHMGSPCGLDFLITWGLKARVPKNEAESLLPLVA